MSTVHEYETSKWQELQSKFTKFLHILEKYGDLKQMKDKDFFLLKILQLNEMVDGIDVVLDELKYECLYLNSEKKNHKKIKAEIEEHLNRKQLIKNLVKLK